MMRNKFLFALFFTLITSTTWACNDRDDDPEFVRLERIVLEKAETQSEMNQASAELAHHTDKQLAQLEAAILKELDQPRREAFQKSCTTWRAFRKTVIDLAGMQHKGGSIEPLDRHLSHAYCTKRRIKELKAYNQYKSDEG
ncbi:MAG: lysozyme inhibitor LprI family protein [Opitutaceae bacterium]